MPKWQGTHYVGRYRWHGGTCGARRMQLGHVSLGPAWQAKQILETNLERIVHVWAENLRWN